MIGRFQLVPKARVVTTATRRGPLVRAASLVEPSPPHDPNPPTSVSRAEHPNQCWQAEILRWLGDYSRYPLSATAHRHVTSTIVHADSSKTVEQHGIPYSTLIDNGVVFGARSSSLALHTDRICALESSTTMAFYLMLKRL